MSTAAIEATRRTITVVGSGCSAASPNLIDVQVSCTATDADLSDAKLKAALRTLTELCTSKFGVKESDVSIASDVGFQAQYSSSGVFSSTTTKTGYSLSQSFAVRNLTDTRRAAGLLDALAAHPLFADGIVAQCRVGAVAAEAARDAARADAIADCKRRAEALAKLSRAKLGALLSLTESNVAAAALPAAVAAAAAADAQGFAVNVAATFEIGDTDGAAHASAAARAADAVTVSFDVEASVPVSTDAVCVRATFHAGANAGNLHAGKSTAEACVATIEAKKAEIADLLTRTCGLPPAAVSFSALLAIRQTAKPDFAASCNFAVYIADRGLLFAVHKALETALPGLCAQHLVSAASAAAARDAARAEALAEAWKRASVYAADFGLARVDCVEECCESADAPEVRNHINQSRMKQQQCGNMKSMLSKVSSSYEPAVYTSPSETSVAASVNATFRLRAAAAAAKSDAPVVA